MTLPEAELDRLFQAPLDQFTPLRDGLARDLRREGERDGADTVKRMRKPSVAAWAINQLRHRHPDRVSELLEAGARLRDAQQGLLSGGDRGALREAAAEERRLVAELVPLAVKALEADGHPVGPAVQTKIHETLHAAAGDEQVRELLAVGRLQREQQLGDLGLIGAGPASARSTKSASARPEPPKADARRLAAAQRRLEQARQRRDERRAQLSEAEREAEKLERSLRRARAAAERARRQLDEATARVRELEGS